jgi:signal transduction histidine kinase/FixJ family two-component response regulator
MVNQRTSELRASNDQLAREIAERGQAQVLLSAFSTLGSLLSTARTVREAGQIIVGTAERLLGWDACRLDLYAPDTNLLTTVLQTDAIDGQRKERIPESPQRPPSELARKALQEGGQLVLKSDLTEMQQAVPAGDSTSLPPSIMLVPVRNGNAATGLLSLQSNAPDPYHPGNLETLQALADHCAGALERIRTEEALRKALEDLRQSQKLEAIGQLAGGIAHDFNNLLAVICGNADLARLEADGCGGKLNECLDEISAASKRAVSLTRQLLTFSRKQMMHLQPLDLDNVIRNLSKMLERIIGEDVALHCQYAAGLPLVQADIGMLEQALVNLVVNARDAMPDGGQLFISASRQTIDAAAALTSPTARPGDFICLTVQDSGAGIAPENIPHIFEPFFTTKEVGKGTGLGLATVYGIIQQHQGWVEVSSKLGSGTTFRMYLPALPAGFPVLGHTPKSGEAPRGKETVLVVEDEKSVRTVTRLQLERGGYRVLEASSGPEALKLWESAAAQVDLLLTDVIMPCGMNGRKLAESLREKKASLKIIFLSGYGGEILGESSDFLRQTNSYFLQKPCAPRDLLCAVRSCLDGLPAQREQIVAPAENSAGKNHPETF